MKSFIVLLIFLIPITLQSQDISSPLSVDNEIKIYKSKLSENPKENLNDLKKLREKSNKINYKRGTYTCTYLIISIYINYFGDFDKVIEETKTGEKIARELNDNEAIADMFQLRGISYIELGMSDVGLGNLNKALTYAIQIKSDQQKYKTLSLIYDNIGGYYDNAQDLEKFVKYKRKSLDEITHVKEENEEDIQLKYRLIAAQNMNIGHFFHKKNQLDSAEHYFLKTHEIYNTKFRLSNFREKADLLNRLSRLYYDRKDFSKSVNFAHLGLNVQKGATTPKLRKELYEIMYLAFLGSKNADSAAYYSAKYTALNDSLSIADKKSVNKSLGRIITEKNTGYSKNITIIVFSSVLIVIIIIISFVLYIRNNKVKTRRKYEALINEIESKSDENLKVKNRVSITDDTLEKILESLNTFEENNEFINKDTSLPKLAHQLDTNTTYLSEVIRQHKNNNFNNYINGLRIKYIIRLLYNNPVFREYKISYLAEKSGFSSREVFTITFKKETGISPSHFIKELKDSRK
ncbi:AraC family transcriptional regulator [Chryseobacterium arthrosphaerae]|uniref:helix-turn-helix domain-containing protein n=1 Tax=Chryseobacterium arthrosphaerae TaxID=651561 RepID=UPI000F5089D9|nr:AraC family transcriptional regulator [Chryseobacterium arthrosphaerae]AYZ12787.1 AraC family transcriptional regulator [Chryseobacterium arthrosphaerae]